MIKIAFIVNGKTGKKDKFFKNMESAQIALSEFDHITKETNHQGHATQLAQKLASAGYVYLIAVGGDGTLNEVINGVMHEVHNCIVGFLPFGTANDFSKTYHIPTSIMQLLDAIKKGKTKSIDVGLMESGAQENAKRRYFINIASVGMSAEVVKKVNASSGFLGSDFTFIRAILSTFMGYKNQLVECKTDLWNWKGKVNTLVVANGKYFGSGLCIAPNADMQDDVFSVVIIGDITIFDYLKNVIKIKRGRPVDHPGVEYKTAQWLEISSSDIACQLEADGELIGSLPARISVIPKGILFIAL